MAAATLESARAAKPAAQRVFAALAGVVGVGITRIGDGVSEFRNLSGPVRLGDDGMSDGIFTHVPLSAPSVRRGINRDGNGLHRQSLFTINTACSLSIT